MLKGDFSSILSKEVKKTIQGNGWAIIYFTDETKATIGIR
jgi:hypothetical protein